jgi:hypothetical protein
MAITTNDDILNPQILIEAVRSKFKGKNAFMGSPLVAGGAVLVSGSMPEGGPKAIGKEITVPYWGQLGEFVNNPDGNAVVPSKLGMTEELSPISRDSLAAELSGWAQGTAAVKAQFGDPYGEASQQIMDAATRAMDRAVVAAAMTTPLIYDLTALTGDQRFLNYQALIRAKALWGDEQDQIVAMVTHSQAEADLAEQLDATGKPLLAVSQSEAGFTRFAGVLTHISDRTPLDGSTMGAVTSSGTTPPAVTLSGTPLGPWTLRIDIVTGGASDGTATFRFSVDGGNTWSATYAVPAGGGAISLDDAHNATVAPITGERTVDSLVGLNGKTGITATFANGTYNANNLYSSTADLVVSTLICQRGAASFWYNQARLGMKTDVDILADTDILAMHLYRVAHRYRRRRGGSRTGVVRIRHKVRGFLG